jgi:hypothetical protein
MRPEMGKILADCVGGSLIPAGMFKSLLRGEDFDKPVGKRVKHIGLPNMLVQRGGIELGDNVNLPQIGVYAV